MLGRSTMWQDRTLGILEEADSVLVFESHSMAAKRGQFRSKTETACDVMAEDVE